MQLQFLPGNSYYLPTPAAGVGGFREMLGSTLARIRTHESALRGLTALTKLELQGVVKDD